MSRLLHNSVCISMLLVASSLNLRESSLGNGVLSPIPPNESPPLPRYYVGPYTQMDREGKTSVMIDESVIETFLQNIRDNLPPMDQSRVLEKDPGDCTATNPCEEISLRDEPADKDEYQITATIIQRPVIPSKILHVPLDCRVAKTSTFSETRNELVLAESWKIIVHDKEHRNPPR